MSDERRLLTIVSIEFESGMGRSDDDVYPFVKMRVVTEDGDVAFVTVSEAQATETAHNLLAAIEASASDVAVFRFLCDKLGVDDARAAGVITDLREYRDDAP